MHLLQSLRKPIAKGNLLQKVVFYRLLLTIGLEPITEKEQILSLQCLPISPSEQRLLPESARCIQKVEVLQGSAINPQESSHLFVSPILFDFLTCLSLFFYLLLLFLFLTFLVVVTFYKVKCTPPIFSFLLFLQGKKKNSLSSLFDPLFFTLWGFCAFYWCFWLCKRQRVCFFYFFFWYQKKTCFLFFFFYLFFLVFFYLFFFPLFSWSWSWSWSFFLWKKENKGKKKTKEKRKQRKKRLKRQRKKE